MTGHTKEPWGHYRDGSRLVVDSEGLVLLDAMSDQNTAAEDAANARRIVDCVNAMAGKDPAAYVAAFDGMVGALDSLLAVASHGSPRADDRVKQWVSATLTARTTLTAARLARGGE